MQHKNCAYNSDKKLLKIHRSTLLHHLYRQTPEQLPHACVCLIQLTVDVSADDDRNKVLCDLDLAQSDVSMLYLDVNCQTSFDFNCS
jgi:hypothetical protein